MGIHQNDQNALDLWLYFESVMTWVKEIFITQRIEMKGVEWGVLYNQFKEKQLDPKSLEVK